MNKHANTTSSLLSQLLAKSKQIQRVVYLSHLWSPLQGKASTNVLIAVYVIDKSQLERKKSSKGTSLFM